MAPSFSHALLVATHVSKNQKNAALEWEPQVQLGLDIALKFCIILIQVFHNLSKSAALWAQICQKRDLELTAQTLKMWL